MGLIPRTHDPLHFPPFGIVIKSFMDTLNLPSFTLGIPIWYLDRPTLPLTPQIMLIPIQSIETMLHPPPSAPKTTPVSIPSPPPPKKTGEKAPKVMTEARPSPACSLCDVQGHATQNCLNFPILHTHMLTIAKTDDILVINVLALPVVKNKAF